MKIALVNHTFSATHGGLERFSVNLTKALLNAGHEVHLFGHRIDEVPAGAIAHQVNMSHKPSFWRAIGFSRNVRQALVSESFDLIYGLTRSFGLDVYRLGDGVQRHWMRLNYPLTPWRWLNYLVNPVHLANLYLESRILGKSGCRRIITNSHLVKRHVQQYYNVADDRVKVVHNGVDTAQFNISAVQKFRDVVRTELGIDANEQVLLYVSNNWKRKGLSVVLRSLSRSSLQVQPHLLIVGRGRAGTYRRLAKILKLDTDRLHFIGPTDSIQKYYGAADLFVLPTMYDPFANVCLEALACGLPVITTTGNGAAEVLIEGETGYIQQRQDDADELAGLFDQAFEPSTLSMLKKNAVHSVEGMTPERNLTEMLDACQELF